MEQVVKEWMKDNLVVLRVRTTISDMEMLQFSSLEEFQELIINSMKDQLIQAITPYLNKVETMSLTHKEIELSLVVKRRKDELPFRDKTDVSDSSSIDHRILCGGQVPPNCS